MARYSLQFKESVAKDLRAILKQDVRRILERIDMLADDPRPRGSEKLSTHELYRIRQGRYRILYEVRDAVLIIIVASVGKRSDVYR